jgi:hypothetical protein
LDPFGLRGLARQILPSLGKFCRNAEILAETTTCKDWETIEEQTKK